MDEAKEPTNGVLLLGLGGGAGRIVSCLARELAPDWIDMLRVDTDAGDLTGASAAGALLIGEDLTRGAGCGGDPTQGERAAGQAVYSLREYIHRQELLIVLACFGRGTASGAAQTVARIARDANVLTFFVVTTPFALEGNGRRQIAEDALAQLRRHADVVVVLPNDLLFTQFPASTGLAEAFAKADRIVAEGVLGLAEVMRCRGIIPIDFASLRTLLRGRDATCSIGIGRAAGEERAIAVVDAVLNSPMLGGRETVDDADVAVATLLGNDLQIGEMNTCLNAINTHLGSVGRTFVGVNDAVPVGGGVQVTLLTIRYHPAAPTAAARPRVAAGSGGRRRQAKPPAERQIDLPFVEEGLSLGIFSNIPPTRHGDENLDIPTFQRRGVVLDL